MPGVRISRTLKSGVELLIGDRAKGANRLTGCRIDTGNSRMDGGGSHDSNTFR
jgi:hypothetical protein